MQPFFGIVYVWEHATGKRLHRLNSKGRLSVGLAFSADSKRLAAMSRWGHGGTWDLDSGRQLASVKLDEGGGGGSDYRETDWVSFTPDGNRIVFSLGSRIKKQGDVEVCENHVYLVDAATG